MGELAGKKKKGVTDHRKGSTKRASPHDTVGKMSPAGAKIVAAFEEAIEAMRSGEPLDRHFTAE